MSTENWRKVVESAPNSDVWTDTYRTGPSEDAQARLDAEWNAAVEAAAKDLDEYAQDSIDAAESITLNAASERIRALKRVTP